MHTPLSLGLLEPDICWVQRDSRLGEGGFIMAIVIRSESDSWEDHPTRKG
jgi:hypothetical protein